MARIRSLKPGFFKNEELCELSPWHRLCFAGLWLVADREGRMEDRPRRLKAEIFPYDDLNMDTLLMGLAEKGFVVRYVADGVPYLAIPTFRAHQRPKTDEAVSVIPAPLLEHPRGIGAGPRSYKGILDLGSGQRTEEPGADVAPLLVADGAILGEVTADGAVCRRAEDFMALWNLRTTPPIARCRELTAKRRRHIKARLTELDLDRWPEVIARIEASDFCRGVNERGWIASFDWLIGSPDVAVKTLEGKYDNRRPRADGALVLRPGSYDAWDCPHVPKCGHPTPCATKAALEQAKRAREAL